MTDEIIEQVSPDNYLAALDIGSNSFHFVLARQIGDHLQIVHSEKYRVQLAQGLDHNNVLNQAAIRRGLSTLEHLATSTHHIKQEYFRAVATFTLRQAKNAREFLTLAAKIFPFHIEIISGHEEARLIYQGVAHHRQNISQQLVIDIGGGSTECIIGKKFKTEILDSLNMGCVNYQQQFFASGEISSSAFKQAIRAAAHEVDSIVKRFKRKGWQKVIGTSGTIKAITKIVNFNQEIERPFTLEDLRALKKQLIDSAHVDNIKISGLKESRRKVICSGVAILIAIMKNLEISEIEFCKYALREGVLFEHLDNIQHSNIRTRTIESFIERFNVDSHHSQMVNNLAQLMFEQVKTNWKLTNPIYAELLYSAIRLHEIGMDINASGFHKHGQYILEQADLAGFNQEQQKALAWLVGNQRKKIALPDEDLWYLLSSEKLIKLCVLIRLSVLLNQQRHGSDNFLFQIKAQGNAIKLSIDKQWLLERPIIDTELYYEQKHLEKELTLQLDVVST